MKIIISTFFIFWSYISFGQITFEEVLAFENKSFKEIQATLLGGKSTGLEPHIPLMHDPHLKMTD